MQIVLPILAVGVLIILNVFIPKKHVTTERKEVKTLGASVSKQETSTPTATPYPTNSVSATASSTLQKQTSPTISPQLNSSDLIYPGAKILAPEGGQLTLESSDNADQITTWYKNKIKTNGINVTSFVTTVTNGNINNVLVGGKNGTETKVTIIKKANESTVKITVSGTSS